MTVAQSCECTVTVTLKCLISCYVNLASTKKMRIKIVQPGFQFEETVCKSLEAGRSTRGIEKCRSYCVAGASGHRGLVAVEGGGSETGGGARGLWPP